MKIPKTKLFYLFISSFFLFAPTGTTQAADIYVTAPVTATTINSAIASAQPGDCVIIPDGTYSAMGQINIPDSIDGTSANPITLKSATPGGVTFTGNCASPLIFIQGDWWIIRDFKFIDVSEVGNANTWGIATRDATGTRVTNNYFEGFGVLTDTNKNSWCIWIGAGGLGYHSRVDNNTFIKNESMCVVINFTALYCQVDHNYFYNSLKDGDNGFEGIYIGGNDNVLYTTVEYNLFENMSADPESISNKSSNNIIRYNVFKSTGGVAVNGLVLRGGDDCIVDGNYFFDVKKNSIRIHGTGHKIINNYFENPEHNAILLAEGSADYANVSDILIANNTIVDTPVRGIYIGWWPGGLVKPNNLTFKNNIIQSSVGTLVRDEGHTGTFIWENNLHYATGGATYWVNDGGGNEPAIGTTHADPNLIQGTHIQRLQATSNNAIQKGTPVAGITDDIDGHARDTTNPDIGCDEYSGLAPIRLPIKESEVGVSWLMPPPAPCPGGNCCSSVESCLGGTFINSSDCGFQCCTGTCTATATPPTPDPTCADSGTCCPAGQLCSGIGENLPGCENVCCTGGTCIDPPASPVCQYKGYQCCNSCKLDPQPDYDGTCPGGEVCCALCVYAPPPPLGEVGPRNPLKTSDFSKIAENILLWSLSIIGSLALLVIIFGGVMYIGSAGDEQKAFTAKKIITFAIFGLMVILGAYAIVKALSEVVT